MYKFRAICNLQKTTPSRAEGASHRVCRSHLNQKVEDGYQVGEIFDCEYISPDGEIWLKDKEGAVLFVLLGEVQCFEDLD
jgi:hypothetical protein